MAHVALGAALGEGALRGVRGVLLCAGVAGACTGAGACSPGRASESARTPAHAAADASTGGTLGHGGWGTFHSKRFELSLPLPDGSRWRIDDHRSAWLKAEHAPSQSSVWLRSWTEDAAATRKLCYARARQWLPSLPELEGASLIDDRVRPLFAAIDTRVAVGAGATASGAGTDGFVVAAGADTHRCIVMVFVTRAGGAGAEDEVASRLLLISERMLAKAQLDQSLAAPSRERPIPSWPGVPRAAR